MKRFAVLGGNGGTGRYIVRQLLEAGHVVRSVGRSRPAHILPEHNGRLEALQADVTDANALPSLVQDMDGVVFAASAGSWRAAADVDYAAVSQVAKACKAEQTPRLLLVSSILVSEKHRYVPIRIFLNTAMAWKLMDYKLRGEDAVRAVGLPSYTIVRPGGMGAPPSSNSFPWPLSHAKVLVSQGDNIRGRILRHDLAATCCAALMSNNTHNTTFEVVQATPKQEADTDHFADVLRNLSTDACA